MRSLNLPASLGPGARILCLGAHSDDIEIGCGGTMLRLAAELPGVEVRWVVLGAEGRRKAEAAESGRLFLRDAPARRVVVRSFRDGFFPYVGAKI
jgi:LmbE family N-acetylglucosaminyl deacetylase